MAVGNDGVDDKNSNEKEAEVEKRICCRCNKVFSSGRALGGHMRVHVPFHKFNEIPLPKVLKLKQRNKSLLVGGEDSKRKWSSDNEKDFRDLIMRNGRPTCSLCNKTFQSPKSLFGHMRCHPERRWRGMLPPPPLTPSPPPLAAKNSSSSTVSDATPGAIRMEDQFDSAATTPTISAAAVAGPVIAIDLLQSISGWSMTAKRGRKSLISSSSVTAEENRDHIPDTAVFGLMMLANSGDCNFNSIDCEARSNWHWEGHEIGDRDRPYGYYISSKKKMMTMKRRQIELEVKMENLSNISPTSKKLRIEERADSGAAAVTKGLGLARSMEEMDNSESSQFVMEKKAVVGVEVDGEEKDNEMMSGKKKRRKRRMMKLRDLKLQLEEVEVEVEEEAGLIRGGGEAVKYRCTACNKCFPTRRALGGHCRSSSHYKFRNCYFMEDSAPPAPAPAAVFATTATMATTTTQEDHVDEQTAVACASASAAPGLTLSSSAAINLSRKCNTSLPRKQVLGGHKRCHCAGGISTAEPSAAAAGSSGEMGSERAAERRILMSFDLNELPAMEVDAAQNEST